MKKYLIIIGSLVAILLITLVLLSFTNNSINNQGCSSKIDLNDIYSSINSSTDSMFDLVSEDDASLYLQLDFSDISDYLIAKRVGADNEFYLIIRNLTKEQLTFLKDMVNAKKKVYPDKFKKTKVETHNGITYVVFSPQYISGIEGIIRDYIYCE